MKVILLNQTQRRIPRKALLATVQSTLDYVRKRPLARRKTNFEFKSLESLVLVFVDPKESRRLNTKFREKKKATDVLSFAPAEEGCLGELVICPEVIEEQAPRFNHSFSKELKLMVIHGMLHLLGWDHERSKKEEEIMFRLQETILKQL